MRIHQLTPRGDRRGNDTGAVAIVVALSLTFFMVLAAFAVDIGNAYAQGRELSVAADADSLAAAASVGNAITPGSDCTTSTLNSLKDSAGQVVGAQTIAKAAADAMNTANNKTGVSSEPVSSVTVTCPTVNSVLVRVENSRDVKTAIAGIIGINTITRNSYAEARYVRTKSAVGLRPWAVCKATMDAAQVLPDTTFWTGIDKDNGPCSSTTAGNWGSIDINGGNNAAGDLGTWTLSGYPGSIDFPSTLPGDPGVSNSSGLKAAFAQLVGKTVPFPTTTGFTCGGTNCTGSNAQFVADGIAMVRVCGIVYGNSTYNIDQSTGNTSDCWVTPNESTSNTTTDTSAATTSTALPVGSLTLDISAPGFPSWTPSANATVSILMTGVWTGNPKDFTSVATFTSATHANLSAAPTKPIPAGTPVTITTTTTTTTAAAKPLPNPGPYISSNLLDHIQFRWVSYPGGTYSGSTPTPCLFSDKACVGITQLWR